MSEEDRRYYSARAAAEAERASGAASRQAALIHAQLAALYRERAGLADPAGYATEVAPEFAQLQTVG